MQSSYTIRTMSKKELAIAIFWAAKEGWNPGLYDADAFYAADPKGFFMGFINKEPIGSISAVSYGEDFGFLGFYIVKSEYRGRGYGIKLWKKARAYLDNRTIGLDGVVEQQENYKKAGFKLAYRNIRYEGKSRNNTKRFSRVVPLSDISFDKLVQYDSSVFPAIRRIFLKKWIQQPDSFAYAATKDKDIIGYGMIRKCQTGYKIGPLFAENKDVAESLFITLQNSIPEASLFFFDVPEINKQAVKLSQTYAMKKMFETARMYTKQAPNIPIHKIFGVTSFELG